MDSSSFKAVGFYHYLKTGEPTKDNQEILHMLIIDVDDYSAALCTCKHEAIIDVVALLKLPTDTDSEKDINDAFRDISKHDKNLFDLVDPCVDSFNSKFKTYLRSRRTIEVDFHDILGFKIECADFERVFETARNKLKKLVEMVDEEQASAGFDESSTSFIIVGRAATLFPIVYYVKELYTFSPFLPDERFVSDDYSDSPCTIAEIGAREYKKKIERERRVIVETFKNNSKIARDVIKVAPNVESMKTCFGPVLFAPTDKLEIEVNGNKQTVSLPNYLFPAGMELLEIGASLKDEQPVVRVRRYHSPTKVLDVKF